MSAGLTGTRRSFFAQLYALSGTASPLAARASHSDKRSLLAYVGSYSSPQGPEGSKGNGQGIYLFEANLSTGALTQKQVFPNDSNPAWLAFHPSGKYLFSANEITNYEGKKSGSVSSYSVDRASGALTTINTVSSEGAGPAHLSVHPSGKYVLVANYAGGTFAVLPVDPRGRLGSATDIKKEEGKIGPLHAASAPLGSFAISGHDRPHGHMIHSDPSGKFVIGADLGLDLIHVWQFDTATGKLSETSSSVTVPAGDGPRHFVFHPNGKWFYSLQEESSTLILFDYQASSGKLTPRQRLSTLPPHFVGTNFTSEVRLSPDSRFLYAANRLHDSIAYFSIGLDGTLKLEGEAWTRGDYPRSFTIDPTGTFLYSCNQRGDAVATFRLNRATGEPSFTGQYTSVGTPGIVVFLT